MRQAYSYPLTADRESAASQRMWDGWLFCEWLGLFWLSAFGKTGQSAVFNGLQHKKTVPKDGFSHLSSIIFILVIQYQKPLQRQHGVYHINGTG